MVLGSVAGLGGRSGSRSRPLNGPGAGGVGRGTRVGGAAVAAGAWQGRAAGVRPYRCRVSDALLPGLDQTRTVGLVTLPGAFVGMLLGGASPVEAGAVQLFVLVALMAVQVVAVATGPGAGRARAVAPGLSAGVLRRG